KQSQNSDEIAMMENDHPLFNTVMKLTSKEVQQTVMPLYEVKLPVPEEMIMELNQITIVDGNGNELEQRLILTGKLSSEDYINISPYILFKCKMEVIEEYSEEEPDIRRHVIRDSRKLLRTAQRKREAYADRRKIFLRKSFEDQMTTLQNRLKKYQAENT